MSGAGVRRRRWSARGVCAQGRTFTVEKSKYVVGSYEHYVHVTSKLIGRNYIARHKLVQDWPLPLIIERYELCTKHAGTMPGAVKWWWLRKKELEANK